MDFSFDRVNTTAVVLAVVVLSGGSLCLYDYALEEAPRALFYLALCLGCNFLLAKTMLVPPLLAMVLSVISLSILHAKHFNLVQSTALGGHAVILRRDRQETARREPLTDSVVNSFSMTQNMTQNNLAGGSWLFMDLVSNCCKAIGAVFSLLAAMLTILASLADKMPKPETPKSTDIQDEFSTRKPEPVPPRNKNKTPPDLPESPLPIWWPKLPETPPPVPRPKESPPARFGSTRPRTPETPLPTSGRTPSMSPEIPPPAPAPLPWTPESLSLWPGSAFIILGVLVLLLILCRRLQPSVHLQANRQNVGPRWWSRFFGRLFARNGGGPEETTTESNSEHGLDGNGSNLQQESPLISGSSSTMRQVSPESSFPNSAGHISDSDRTNLGDGLDGNGSNPQQRTLSSLGGSGVSDGSDEVLSSQTPSLSPSSHRQNVGSRRPRVRRPSVGDSISSLSGGRPQQNDQPHVVVAASVDQHSSAHSSVGSRQEPPSQPLNSTPQLGPTFSSVNRAISRGIVGTVPSPQFSICRDCISISLGDGPLEEDVSSPSLGQPICRDCVSKVFEGRAHNDASSSCRKRKHSAISICGDCVVERDRDDGDEHEVAATLPAFAVVSQMQREERPSGTSVGQPPPQNQQQSESPPLPPQLHRESQTPPDF